MYILRRIVNKAIKLNNWLIVIGTVLFFAFSSLIFCYIEPETFKNPFLALWYVMTTVTTVGYGDIYPTTNAGRLYAMVVYLFGIGLGGLIIGKIIDGLGTYRRRKDGGKLKYRGKNHVVVIGWSRKSELAVQEILDSNDDVEVVLIDQLAETPVSNDRVHYVHGKAANIETLEQAAVERAHAVLVFADNSIEDKQLIDGKTLLIITSVEHYAPQVYTMVEITDASNVKNFHYVKVNDFILPNDMISKLAVRAIFNHGISSVYNRLVSQNAGENLYYLPGIKADWKTYRDAFDELIGRGATLIGDGEDLSINRRLDEPIPEDARLCVIANGVDYKWIIGEL